MLTFIFNNDIVVVRLVGCSHLVQFYWHSNPVNSYILKEMLENIEIDLFKPLTSMIEIVRDPMIGIMQDLKVYLFNFLLMIILYLANYLVIKFKGQRIVLV